MGTMMRSLGIGALAMVLGFGAPAAARADAVLYSQATDLNFGFASQYDPGAYYGDTNVAVTYDSFILASGSQINSVDWVGSYANGPPTMGTITGFTIDIYADSSDSPGVLLASSSISGNANETPTGTDNVGDPYSTYSAALNAPFAAMGGTQYWLSIVPTMDGPPQWYWETSSQGASNLYQSVFGGPPTLQTDGNGNGYNAAFTLYGSSIVPEPSALVLGTMGGMGVVVLYGRRRRSMA